MTRRLSIAIAMAAALSLGAAADVGAQQGMRVQKDRRTYGAAGGAVERDSAAALDSMRMAAQRDSIARLEQARQDSIMRVEQARRDSIAAAERARQDSIMRVEQARRDSIARADSIRMAQEQAWYSARGFHIGLAGGAAVPSGNLGDAYDAGWNVTVPIGWQRPLSPLGVRLDLAYNRFGAQLEGADDLSEWSALLHAKWLLGLGTPDLTQPVSRRTGLYLIGGGGWHSFRDVDETGDDESSFGVDGGAGFQCGWGMNTLFVEARYVSAFTDEENTNYIPVILGITF